MSWILQAGLILIIFGRSAASDNITVNLSIWPTKIEYGKNLSIICITQKICQGNSWSVRKQNGFTFETVVRESRSFYPTEYGAHLNIDGNATTYTLLVYNLKNDDLSSDYRCECDEIQGYITDIKDKLTVVNGTKNSKDSSDTEVIVGGISGIVILSIVLVCAICHCSKKRQKTKQEDIEMSTSKLQSAYQKEHAAATDMEKKHMLPYQTKQTSAV